MDEALTVKRWRKFGKDRLYIETADGDRIGWHDLLDGHAEVERPDLSDAFHATVQEWLTSHPDRPPALGPTAKAISSSDGGAAPALQPPAPIAAGSPSDADGSELAEPASAEEERQTLQPEPAWQDLVDRAAGAAAREQALALKRAAPVRTFIARALRVKNDERAWRIGADGEEMVAAQLGKLGKRDPRWRFLHALPVGARGSDIDHLVVGPGGIYTLNAKHHPGANVWVGGDVFLLNGQRQPYIRNSRHEARRAGRLLTEACGRPLRAIGVIVPVGAATIKLKAEPEEVHIVNRMRLVKWLEAQEPALDDETVECVFQAARRSTTWQP